MQELLRCKLLKYGLKIKEKMQDSQDDKDSEDNAMNKKARDVSYGLAKGNNSQN
jgi:hypothetical protein